MRKSRAGRSAGNLPASLRTACSLNISITRPSGPTWSSLGRISAVEQRCRHLENGIPAVRGGFVRAEDAEIARVGVGLQHVADELALDARDFGLRLRASATFTA